MNAAFSEDGLYRYTLPRAPLGGEGRCVFIMLNPSVADDRVDDPTTRRCVDYAIRWGYGEYIAVNLFAYRAQNPRDMLATPEPVGPENDHYLRDMTATADLIVAAWGTHGTHRGRDQVVRDLLRDRSLHILALTKHGQPKHPLYLRKDLQPIPWAPPETPGSEEGAG